ncbi:hypothetical protein M514_04247 [Trichuris suis]|uniref:Uncharacterized protein n=1 Tax=Trichuris suis TaxID=68888 RepID=A0A085MC67_9BILA|nr:hypothetical protein M513_04247 [Trichuris suis]KFD71686.1 hypothetical protein M514_04247 [Trichuris suis]
MHRAVHTSKEVIQREDQSLLRLLLNRGVPLWRVHRNLFNPLPIQQCRHGPASGSKSFAMAIAAISTEMHRAVHTSKEVIQREDQSLLRLLLMLTHCFRAATLKFLLQNGPPNAKTRF